jgi:hypothetical protein
MDPVSKMLYILNIPQTMETVQHNIVEPPFHIPQFKVFPSFNVQFQWFQHIKFPTLKVFFNSVFKSTASQRILKWGFCYICIQVGKAWSVPKCTEFPHEFLLNFLRLNFSIRNLFIVCLLTANQNYISLWANLILETCVLFSSVYFIFLAVIKKLKMTTNKTIIVPVVLQEC